MNNHNQKLRGTKFPYHKEPRTVILDDVDGLDNKTVSRVMSELGRRGGASKSEAKKKAVRKSLAKARKARWLQKSV